MTKRCSFSEISLEETASTLCIRPRKIYGDESFGSRSDASEIFADRIVVGTSGKQGRPKTNQHSDGTREHEVAFRKHLHRRFGGVVKQELRAPIEQVRLFGIDLGCALVFADCVEGISELFFSVPSRWCNSALSFAPIKPFAPSRALA